MKRSLQTGLLAVLFLAFGASVALAQSASPVGQWQTVDDDTGEVRSVVEIYEEGGELKGRVVEIVQASGNARRNDQGQIICTACEGSKNNQPIEGMVILEGLEEDGDEWTGGTILDPERGKTYNAKISLDGEDRLKVRGYIGVSLFGRTQTWRRADS